jgi:fatty acid desaturase
LSSFQVAARIAFYAILAGAMTYLEVWWQFLTFWLLPIATSLPFFMRIRSIAEHYSLSLADELSSSRNVIPSPVERLFLGLHNSHLHMDHHLYPSVPFYNLGRLHSRLLENSAYRARAKENLSYFTRPASSLWCDLVSGSSSDAGSPAH